MSNDKIIGEYSLVKPEALCREFVVRGLYDKVDECVKELASGDFKWFSRLKSIGAIAYESGGYSKWIRIVYEVMKTLEALTGKNIEINDSILKRLMKTAKSGAKPYCPCSLRWGDHLVCPCIYTFKEVIEKGRCTCGLYKIEKVEVKKK